MARKKKEAPVCPRCDADHFSVLGFTFTDERRMESLVFLVSSHPELIRRLETESLPN